MAVTVTTVDEMQSYAADVLSAMRYNKSGSSATTLLLEGPLGAGKTTLVQCLARLLGVSQSVTSPTFVLRSEYETDDKDFKRLVHIDAYRIESDRDGATIGWDDFSRDPETLVAIEWPEHVTFFLPKHAYRITITLDGDARILTTT